MNDGMIVIAAAIAGIVGILLGLSLGFLTGGRNRGVDETVQPNPPPSTRNTPKGSIEVLSLWLNDRTGKLLAMLEGKPISPSHLTDEQKTKISQLLSGLHSMIGDDSPPPTPASISQPTPPALIREEPSAISPSTESDQLDLSPESSPSSGQAEKVYFSDSLPEPVSFGQALLSNPFKVNPPPASKKPVNAPKSIVEQIDEIFQTKLLGSPYENHGIQLKESPNGMTILVGSYRYEGIDAVPDPAIRALIKEAAREWNDKTSKHR